MTKLAHLDGLRARIPHVDEQYLDDHIGLIKQKVCYIDLLKFRTQNKYHGIDLQTLEKLCHGKMLVHNGPLEYVDERTKSIRKNKIWRHHVTLYQPTLSAIELLDHWARELKLPYVISKLEISLDLITDSILDARKVHHFLNHHFIMLRHGSNELYFHPGQTTYLTQRKKGRSYVIYSDRHSKPVDLPCCHIEARFNSWKTINRYKLSQFSSILDLDAKDFWKKHLHLRYINTQNFLRRIDTYEGKRWAQEATGRFPLPHSMSRGEYIRKKADIFWKCCTSNRSERENAYLEMSGDCLDMPDGGVRDPFSCESPRELTMLPAQLLCDYGKEHGYGGIDQLLIFPVDAFLPTANII